MIIEDRQSKILELLASEPDLKVADLSRRLFVSEPTVRRDLTELAAKGLVRKVYGGARLTGPADGEIPFVLREKEKSRAKAELAKRAAALVQDGSVIFLDASTSAFHLVPYFASHRDLIVITAGARTAIELAKAGIRTFSTGGQMILNSFSYVGRQAEDFCRNFHADICFVSCRGVAWDGTLTDRSVEEANVRRVMMEQSRRRVLLADGEKFGKTFFFTQGHTREMDAVISDRPLPADLPLRETSWED